MGLCRLKSIQTPLWAVACLSQLKREEASAPFSLLQLQAALHGSVSRVCDADACKRVVNIPGYGLQLQSFYTMHTTSSL
jgi:hypothetical protein